MKKLMLSLALFCWWTPPSSAATIMTYQGRLKESDLPVTGTRSFSFSICDSLANITGCTASPDGAQSFEVANGLFKSTFTLPTVDFSAGPWYLQVAVSVPPALPQALSPRERLTFVPYSVYALSASTASALAASSGPGISASTNVIVAGSLAAGDAGVQLSTDAAVEGYAVLQNLSGTGVQDIRVAVEGRVYSQTPDPADAMAGGNFEAEVPAGKNGMLVGVRTRNAVDAAGSSPQSIGLMVDALDNKGSITDTYGVYIASQTGGTQVHRPYALYSEDVNASSYFAGNVGIGTSAPAYALVVSSASGDVMWVSSYAVHALKFVGDGSGLSGVTGASGTDPNALHLTGGTMAGGIDMAGYLVANVSTITIQSGSIAMVPSGTGGSNNAYGISIGSNTYDNYSVGVGVGAGAYANYSGGVGVGYSASQNYYGGVGVGELSNVNYSSGVGVGYQAYNNYNGGVGIGRNAHDNNANGVGVGNTSYGNNNSGVGVGPFSYNNYTYGVGVGAGAANNSNYGVGVGAYSANNQNFAAAFGAYSYANSSGTALGANSQATAPNSVAIGNGTVNNSTDTASFGTYGIYTSSDVFAATFHGSGAGLTGVPGDNLGDHTATQPLKMNNYAVVGASAVSAGYYQVNSSTVMAVFAGGTSLGLGLSAGELDTGSDNVFLGYRSGHLNANGGQNVFVGSDAGLNNTSGNLNSFLGYASGGFNTTGENNSFIGNQSGTDNTTGSNNSYLGYASGWGNDVGSANVMAGNETGGAGGGGGNISSSTVLGYRAGWHLAASNNNILIGYQAGASVTSGSGNIVIGGSMDTSAPAASNELNIGGVLYGDLSAKAIGISTRAPQAALDVVSAGVYAQIWRGSGGNIVSSLTATGILSANKFVGDGSGITGVSATDNSKLPLAGGTMTGSIDLSANPLLNVSSLTVVGDGLRIATSPYSGANGILVTPLGALQTQGPGVGGVIAGPRGSGAIDLQVMRTSNAQAASGTYAVVGGGEENTASQLDAVVPGGAYNTASGQYSFAAGYASQSTGANTFTWQDSGGNFLNNSVNDRVVFKAKGGFLVTGSTIPTISATVNRGVFMTGDGRLGVSTGAPQAALDVVSTGTAPNVYAQIWRDSNGNAVSSVTSQGYFYGNGSGLTGIGLPAVSTITIAGDSLAIVPAGTGGSNYAYGISIGSDTYDNYSYGVGMGYDASNNYNSGVGVGFGASGNNLGGVGVGSGASGNSGNGVGVGVGAFNNSGYGVGVGASAVGNSGYGVGVGAYSQNNQNFASAFGAYSYANSSGTALGSYARATAPGSVAIGAGTVNTSTGTASFGIYGIYTSSDVFAAAFRGDGITISTAGAVQTAGVGNGTVAGNPRGSGAVDLQTYRSGPAQVASGDYSVIGGGANNTAESNAAAIAGGETNYVEAAAPYSFIGGGYQNDVQMPFSMIGGGDFNVVSGSYAVIAGGQNNNAYADYASVSGGYMNAVASGANGAFIGGGSGNGASGMYASLGGGQGNSAAAYSAVMGGVSNNANGGYAAVVGGSTNTATGMASFVGGGQYNQASGQGAFVGAGKYNHANGDYSSVPGGLENSAVAQYSFAAGYQSSSTAMGTFTWKDSSPGSLENNVPDQVMFEAAGGFWVSTGTAISAPAFYVDTNNRVGIGTMSPAVKLEVHSDFAGAISGFSDSGGAATDAAVYGFSSASSNASAVKGVSYGSGYAARFEGNVYMTSSGTNGRIGMGVPPAAGAMTMISDTAAADPYVLRVGTGTLPAMLNVSSGGVVGMPLQSMSEAQFSGASLAAGSWSSITYYSVPTINTQNEFDYTTGKFTASSPGMYLVSGMLSFSSAVSTLVGIGINKNGAASPQYMQTRLGDNNASVESLTISYPVALGAGDYVQLSGYSASGYSPSGVMTVVKLN